MEVTTKDADGRVRYYEVREITDVRPAPIPPIIPPEPAPVPTPVPTPPPPKDEGFIALENARVHDKGAQTFKVDIVGGTNTPVGGFSIFVGYKTGLVALGIEPGKFITDYIEKPFEVFVNHPDGSRGAAAAGQHLVMMYGFWNFSNTSMPHVVIPSNTVLATLLFKWTKPGTYVLDNATEKYGRRDRPLPAMYTRTTGRYIPPELESLTVKVPIT